MNGTYTRTQGLLQTHEKNACSGKKTRFMTALDLIKCLNQYQINKSSIRPFLSYLSFLGTVSVLSYAVFEF